MPLELGGVDLEASGDTFHNIVNIPVFCDERVIFSFLGLVFPASDIHIKSAIIN